MDRTLSTSTTATAALSSNWRAATQLGEVDTFGKMEDASRAFAAERGRGGGYGGTARSGRARRRSTAAAR